MFENPKQECHDAKFHDGLAIKDVKATCDTTAAPKRMWKGLNRNLGFIIVY